MGLRLFNSMSSCGMSRPAPTPPTLPNPDPRSFVIQHHVKMGNMVILIVVYPGCTTFEGRKILVFRGVSLRKLLALKELDPHFCDDPAHPSPVARFRPDDQGWEDAVRFCQAISG